MRLIDADRLEKEMNDLCCGECEVCGLSDCPAHSQPTAYDVDKVVELLEEKIINTTDTQIGIASRMAFGKTIEIVKAGGINENW